MREGSQALSSAMLRLTDAKIRGAGGCGIGAGRRGRVASVQHRLVGGSGAARTSPYSRAIPIERVAFPAIFAG